MIDVFISCKLEKALTLVGNWDKSEFSEDPNRAINKELIKNETDGLKGQTPNKDIWVMRSHIIDMTMTRISSISR